jgi:glycerol-3-phosphate dehydrogenase
MLIIGGGIHGAAFARIAALNGIECTLLEKQDYAAGTSSRSTKLAHGGLRYLETFDFQQVFEGIKAREELFESAPHVCRPTQFLIPVNKNDWWFRIKLGIGLHLYDLMCRSKERKHKWIPREKLNFEGFHSNRTDLMGCYAYFDGIMNDARLVIESITHARQLGARCLNYISVSKVEKLSDGKFLVEALDELTGTKYKLTSDLVVNCAGPWIPFIGHQESKNLSNQLRYSAGVHLLFNRPWNQPALFLPMNEKARYYFVLPHPAGTMVGTTERDVTQIPLEQLPIKEEVDEILERLKKDLPDSGLNKDTLHYCFAGVRTLALRDDDPKKTAVLSRKHIWKNVDGILTLLGGKWTTSAWTSFEGFKIACKKLNINIANVKSLNGIKYPGYATQTELSQIQQQLVNQKIPENTAKRIVRRLGAITNYLLEAPGRLELITDNLTNGEVELGVKIEQAIKVEDILRRRTEIEYLPGNGVKELQSVGQIIADALKVDIDQHDIQKYQSRINVLNSLF